MPKYQVSFDRRDRLTIELEAFNEDDAIEKAEYLTRDLRQFDIDDERIELRDVEECEPEYYDYDNDEAVS